MNIFKYLWQKIVNFIYYLGFLILVVILYPILHCKVKGKKNIKKTDEARIFISNHLEIYGPTLIYLRLPVRKKRYWIIDKIMDKETVERQMRWGIDNENNYKWAPKWLKNIAVKVLKNFVVYVLKVRVKGISVSRDNEREIIKTFKTSVDALNKKQNLCIFPEVSYQEKGIGDVFPTFAVFAKYFYKKTGKKISYYPVYIDKANKQMNIGNKITYDPDNENSVDEIVNYVCKTINDFAESAPLSKRELKNLAKSEKNDTKTTSSDAENAENSMPSENLNAVANSNNLENSQSVNNVNNSQDIENSQNINNSQSENSQDDVQNVENSQNVDNSQNFANQENNEDTNQVA